MPAIDMDAESSVIWHLLLDAGIATEEQLEEAYEESVMNNRPFIDPYNYEIITEDNLLQLIAENMGTEVHSFHKKKADEEIWPRLLRIRHFYNVIPVAEEGDTLVVAARVPLNHKLIDELPFALNRECRVLVGYPAEIDELMDVVYPEANNSVEGVLDELKAIHQNRKIDVNDVASLERAANDAPIVRFVNIILQQAIKDKASDIHFEPFSDEFRIRYRIDGALFEMAPPPKHLAVPVISRIKVMSGLNIAERRVPQDGRIELRISKRPIDLRVSTLPTRYGESVVLRVLGRAVVNLGPGFTGNDTQNRP